MRKDISAIAASMFLLSCGNLTEERDPIFVLQDFESDSSEFSYLPRSGYVDKPEVAVGIAEAIAIRFYGRNEIENQRPYLVKRLDDRWVVQGSFPQDKDMKGGVFEIEVSSSDGKILRLMHGE